MLTHVKRINTLLNSLRSHFIEVLMMALLPVLTLISAEYMVQGRFALAPHILLYNSIFYFAGLLLLVALLGSIRRGGRALLAITWLFGTINYVVLTYRSTPIMPSDFRSLGTAVNVAGGYSFPFKLHHLLGTLGLVLLALGLQRSQWRGQRRATRLILASIGGVIAISFGTTVLHPWAPYHMNFDATIHQPELMLRENGAVLTFVHALRYQEVEQPESYSLERVLSLAEAYQSELSAVDPARTLNVAMLSSSPMNPSFHEAPLDPASLSTEGLADYLNGPAQTRLPMEGTPDIVVIMNESFADIRQLTELSTNLEITPILNRLETDAQAGTSHVSIIGGNTATSEFEFLTGCSMAFLPQGVIAYQQYLETETPSLVSVLKSQGYQAHALHPFNARGWERDRVYPLLGFDSMTFLEDWDPNAPLRRDYITDESVYANIQTQLDLESDAPQFIFAVTMQNHGPYGEAYPNFEEAIELTDPESSPELDQYVSLIHESDRALGEFLAEIKHRRRPTLVLFFGDHQPNNTVMKPLLDPMEETFGKDHPELDLRRRQTPFLLWANYDIPEASEIDTSLNYLANRVLDQTDLRRSAWFAFLKDAEATMPVLNGGYAMTNDGRFHTLAEGFMDPFYDDYEVLQYNYLFDTEHRVNELFMVPN